MPPSTDQAVTKYCKLRVNPYVWVPCGIITAALLVSIVIGMIAFARMDRNTVKEIQGGKVEGVIVNTSSPAKTRIVENPDQLGGRTRNKDLGLTATVVV